MAITLSRPDRSQFFLWGYIQDRVINNLSTAITELNEGVLAAVTSFTEENIQKSGKKGIPYAVVLAPKWCSFKK